MEAATSQAQSDADLQQIDMQVMKDAVLLPAVYSKALLYRGPSLTNVYVQQLLRDVQLRSARHEVEPIASAHTAT